MSLIVRLNKEEALRKIKHFCTYQERSHSEVKEKLYSFKLFKAQVEEIIAELIETDFLNEERFARLFAGGKFRMKQWGRKKIQYELQQKGVHRVNINIGLKEIEEKEYIETLHKLAIKKSSELKELNQATIQAKTFAYLLQKGYEPDLISKVIRAISHVP
jgi:regulatory protein